MCVESWFHVAFWHRSGFKSEATIIGTENAIEQNLTDNGHTLIEMERIN